MREALKGRGALLSLAAVVIGCETSAPTSPIPAAATTSSPVASSSSVASSPVASSSSPPRAEQPPDRGSLLACGLSGGCVIDADGSVRCWGENHFGQAGVGSKGPARVPPGAKVKGLKEAASIASGIHHTCALTKQGDVFCWGANYSGQTGDGAALPAPDAPGPSPFHAAAVRVALPAKATAIGAGITHSCAALATGSVVCWGSNDFGELGAPGPSTSSPLVVPGVSGALEVALGTQHACARDGRGEVTCWGTFTGGADAPTRLPVLCAKQITAGSHFTCAIDCDGRPVCMGTVPGRSGGGGRPDGGLLPVPGAQPDVAEIRAGYWHVCVRDGAGGLACLGGNDSGQLGVGKGPSWSDDFKDVATTVAGPWTSGVRAICAGGMNIRPDGRYRRPSSFAEAGASCALTASDEVYCWGEPDLSYTPVLVTRRRAVAPSK